MTILIGLTIFLLALLLGFMLGAIVTALYLLNPDETEQGK